MLLWEFSYSASDSRFPTSASLSKCREKTNTHDHLVASAAQRHLALSDIILYLTLFMKYFILFF